MIKKYSIPQSWLLNFFSREFYKDVASNWRGLGYLALFFLLAICWLPLSAKFQMTVNLFITQTAPDVVKQIPEIKIKNGEVQTPLNQPYVITKDPESYQPLAIIDTSGKYTNLVDTQAQFLLTKHMFMMRNDDGTIKEIPIEKEMNGVINQSVINEFLAKIKNYGGIGYYIIGVAFSFLYRIIQGFLYSLIGVFIFTKIQKSNLGFKQILRLCSFVIMPSIIISTIFDFLNIHYRYEYLSFFALSMIYLIYAMHVNRNNALPAKQEQ